MSERTMMNTAEPVNSYRVISEALPDLITSDDTDDLRGAFIAAKYLRAHDGSDRETDNLVGAFSNVLNNRVFQEAVSQKYRTNPGSLVDRGLTSLHERFIGPYAHKRNVAEALFSLAEYKLVHGDWTSLNKASLDFSRALDIAGGPVRVRMMQRWLKPHFAKVTAEQRFIEISNVRRIGALAAYQVYKENSLDPSDRFATAIVYGRALRRMRKDVSGKEIYTIEPRSTAANI